MEQRRVHPQQPTHRAHDSSSFDILPSPFYPTFSDILGGDTKATQPPHPSPQYVQQQYAHDGDTPLEAQRPPPAPYCLQEHPQQGHSHIGNPATHPALQQPQPRPAAAYHLFPHDHGGHNPAPEVLYHQPSRAPHQLPHMSDPWFYSAFTDTAGAQQRGGITRLDDLTYTHHPQPRYFLPTTQHSSATHTPPEHSPTTTVPGAPTFHEKQHGNERNTEASQRSRSWGAGSLDPTTGVFSRAADHHRIRTAQACEKCRARKAKCSGDHPTCQRCQQRGLPCAYAAERRMRGPNKPKPPPPLLPDGSQPAAAEGQKTRRRASTMPSAPRRGSLIWGQQQKHKQNPQLQDVVVLATTSAAPPASPASSAGSGSFGYPPLSESEASPMTPHSSLGGSRRPSGVGFPASPPAHVQDFSATTRSGVLSHVSGGNGYEEDGAIPVDGVVAGPGVYEQDILPDVRMSFESAKPLF